MAGSVWGAYVFVIGWVGERHCVCIFIEGSIDLVYTCALVVVKPFCEGHLHFTCSAAVMHTLFYSCEWSMSLLLCALHVYSMDTYLQWCIYRMISNRCHLNIIPALKGAY